MGTILFQTTREIIENMLHMATLWPSNTLCVFSKPQYRLNWQVMIRVTVSLHYFDFFRRHYIEPTASQKEESPLRFCTLSSALTWILSESASSFQDTIVWGCGLIECYSISIYLVFPQCSTQVKQFRQKPEALFLREVPKGHVVLTWPIVKGSLMAWSGWGLLYPSIAAVYLY